MLIFGKLTRERDEPMDIATIEKKRRDVLDAMERIRAMRPGTLTEQFLKVPQKGQKEPARRGPYYLWQFYEKGKPVRRRVSGKELERARDEVNNRKQFAALCEEFEGLTRQLGELERKQQVSDETLKKKPKSQSRKTGRSSES